MCFVNDDYDWVASHVEDDVLTATRPTRCDECHGRIHAGEKYRHLDMRQHEECRRCEYDDGDRDEPFDPENPMCKAGEHDFGETYQHDICDRCQRILAAIQQAEQEAGCHASESQPALGELFDIGRDVWDEYTGRFARLGLLDEVALIPSPDDDERHESLGDEFDGYWCDQTPAHKRFTPTPWDDLGVAG